MVKIQDDCVDCATGTYPCLGKTCPYVNVTHYYCDSCGDDVDVLWNTDDGELCLNCLSERDNLIQLLDEFYDRVE